MHVKRYDGLYDERATDGQIKRFDCLPVAPLCQNHLCSMKKQIEGTQKQVKMLPFIFIFHSSND